MTSFSTLFSVERAALASVLLEVPSSAIVQFGVKTQEIFTPYVYALERGMEFLSSSVPSIGSFQQSVKAKLHEYSTERFGFPAPYKRTLPLMNPEDILLATLGFLFIWTLTLFFSRIILGSRYHRFTLLGFLIYPLLAGACLYVSLAAGFAARASGYDLWNNPTGTTLNERRITKIWWCFLVVRMAEWVEALWLVLRHKHRRCFFDLVRFTISLPLTWLIGVVSPAGDTYFFLMVSAGVQFMIYLHNMLVLMIFSRAEVPSQREGMNKMIVIGMLIQFLSFGAQFGYCFIYNEKVDQESNPSSVLLSLGYTTGLLVSFALSFPANTAKSVTSPLNVKKPKKSPKPQHSKSDSQSPPSKGKNESKVEGRTKAQEKQMTKKNSEGATSKKKNK